MNETTRIKVIIALDNIYKKLDALVTRMEKQNNYKSYLIERPVKKYNRYANTHQG